MIPNQRLGICGQFGDFCRRKICSHLNFTSSQIILTLQSISTRSQKTLIWWFFEEVCLVTRFIFFSAVSHIQSIFLWKHYPFYTYSKTIQHPTKLRKIYSCVYFVMWWHVFLCFFVFVVYVFCSQLDYFVVKSWWGNDTKKTNIFNLFCSQNIVNLQFCL